MLECSMLQYITYTLLPVHLFPSFSFLSLWSSSTPSTRVDGLTFSLSLSVFLYRSTVGPISLPLRLRSLRSIVLPLVARRRVVFAARSSLHRGRRGNTRVAATGKFLRLSIFWQIATLSSSTILNSEYT